LGRVLYISCTKFLTNLAQKSLCLILTSVFSLFEISHFYMIFFFVSINCFIWSSHILNTFSYVVSLFFLDFHLLLILICLFKFFHSFSMSISFSFVLFKWSFTLWVYSYLMLSSFSNLTLKILSVLMGRFCCPCLTIVVENLIYS